MQAKRNEIRNEPEDCNKTTTQIWKSYMEVKIKKTKAKNRPAAMHIVCTLHSNPAFQKISVFALKQKIALFLNIITLKLLHLNLHT